MSKLDHPACPRAYACGRDAENVYIAYAYVPGSTFRESLRAGRVTDAVAVEVAAQVLDGLAHAHERGIVHRDVKPANVLLADDGDGEASPSASSTSASRDSRRARRSPPQATFRGRSRTSRPSGCTGSPRARPETSGRSASCSTRRWPGGIRSGGRRSARPPRRSRRDRRRCAPSGPTCRTGCSRQSTGRSSSTRRSAPRPRSSRGCSDAHAATTAAPPATSRPSTAAASCRHSCAGIYAAGAAALLPFYPARARAAARGRGRRADAGRASVRARVRARACRSSRSATPRSAWRCSTRRSPPLRGSRSC